MMASRDLITLLAAAPTWVGPPPFVLGVTKPDATNTGVPAGMALTPWGDGTGDYYITTAGTVLEGRDIYGSVIVQAPYVKIKNCRIRGKNSTSPSGYSTAPALVTGNANSDGLEIERSTLVADAPTYWRCGVKAAKTHTLRRCNVHHVIDGVNARDASCRLIAEGNWIHDLFFIYNSPDQTGSTYKPGWTHNDCIQLSGGDWAPTLGPTGGHRIVGNALDGKIAGDAGDYQVLIDDPDRYADLQWGSPITVSPDNGKVTGVFIDSNWMTGGASAFQAGFTAVAPGPNADFGTVSNNRVDINQHDWNAGPTLDNYQIRYTTGYTLVGELTNYFDPDSPTMPAEKRGQLLTVGFSGGIRRT